MTVTEPEIGEGVALSLRSAACAGCPLADPVVLTTNEAIELMEALQSLLMLGKEKKQDGNNDSTD